MAGPTFDRFRPHPWHGLDIGPEPPSIVQCFVEITPFDLVKYEVDKATGYLRVDRPQGTSSLPPSLYGFIPRTWCGERVGRLMPGATHGDRDPLDVCVLSERPIARAEVILTARVVGGLPMLDRGEADDKIIAVLLNDLQWGEVRELDELPRSLVDRLRHYFATYKILPGQSPGWGEVPAMPGRPGQLSESVIGEPYGSSHAERVVRAAIDDYAAAYGDGGRGDPERAGASAR